MTSLHKDPHNDRAQATAPSAGAAAGRSARALVTRTADRDFRIPAVLHRDNQLTVFFDERPHPSGDFDWENLGGAMAADLPNPNRICYITAKLPAPGTPLRAQDLEFSAPLPVPGTPAVCGDPCVAGAPVASATGADAAAPTAAGNDAGITLAYAASEEIGYFGSRFDGPRLEAWIAWGTSLDSLSHTRVDDELYSELRCDGLFATSGSTPLLGDTALLPYVTNRGGEAVIYVVHVRAGKIVAISEPIRPVGTPGLDETTLEVCGGEVIANIRLQGCGGRVVARSSDGLSWSEPQPLNFPDPGCNAKLITCGDGTVLIHPHSDTARENGAIIDDAGRLLRSLGPGEFGYSDAVWLADNLAVVFERENSLYLDLIPGEELR
ncbi:MAG: sialidase family protein [Actinotignum sanguinis]|uniref:sialidase family protein n=1 Tax=Actinomycetaceae TaxID=2049 RepID=UPI00237E0484|nr:MULTISPECIES: sialidase family protein [Actinotignum]MDK6787970.1 sialidase family protein [Actinotignum timonense]MDE1553084.1 sialidase family protein [Actinotignum sanguinis]MDE1565206.1 sialidase family protein [Actinotignum sanguinis]MDE1577713.1 sialidase family protein [Actinotignum sanguinis]MDE1642054.1 sialidase family protein [Actinotignum sanguinis]